MIQDLRVVDRPMTDDDALDSGLARMSWDWAMVSARFAIRRPGDQLALYVAPMGSPDPEIEWAAWWHVRDLPEPADHLLPCGCLPTDADAHRTGCPLYPKGKRSPVNPCPYTFAHTRHWCGYDTCRDS